MWLSTKCKTCGYEISKKADQTSNPLSFCGNCGIKLLDDIQPHNTDNVDQNQATMVNKEMERAKTKFPWWPEDQIHAAAIVAKEAGELLQTALQCK